MEIAGQMTKVTRSFPHVPSNNDEITRHYNGNGREEKRLQRDWIEPEPEEDLEWVARPMQYFIRSTVLGGEVVTEVNDTGKKLRTFVHAAGQVIAWQVMGHYEPSSYTETIHFLHADANLLSQKTTTQSGSITYGLDHEAAPVEFDPTGNNAGFFNPYPDRTTKEDRGQTCNSRGVS